MNVKLLTSLVLGIALLGGCATTPATPVTPQTPDAAVDAFLRDYVGHQFGDDIAEINQTKDEAYILPMKKNFEQFNKAACYYRKGKLYRIQLQADIDVGQSLDNTDEEIRKSTIAFARLAMLPENFFAHHYNNWRKWNVAPLWKPSDKNGECETEGLTYDLESSTIALDGTMQRYVIGIVDKEIDAATKR